MSILVNNISNINKAIKKKSVISIEKFNVKFISLLDVLWNKNYILGYKLKNNLIYVYYKYTRLGTPVLKSIDLVSKPSHSYFFKSYEKHNVPSIYVMSTSDKGLFITNSYTKNCIGKILYKINI